MWTFQTHDLADGTSKRVELFSANTRLSFADVLDSWRKDKGFRSFYSAMLADIGYLAFRWETPAITRSTIKRDYEFVVLDCPGLDRTPDPRAFGKQLGTSHTADSVVKFSNLGYDAVLVVPKPIADSKAYGHIARFVRNAPDQQQQDLWITVGNAGTNQRTTSVVEYRRDGRCLASRKIGRSS